MANKIQAYQAYSPRVKINGMSDMVTVTSFIEGRSTNSASTVVSVLMELKECLLYLAKQGRSMRFKGLGTFAPKIDKNGKFGINFRPDSDMINELNKKGFYKGDIVNPDMIGKTEEEFIDRWNAEHPDDKIKKEKKPGKK